MENQQQNLKARNNYGSERMKKQVRQLKKSEKIAGNYTPNLHKCLIYAAMCLVMTFPVALFAISACFKQL